MATQSLRAAAERDPRGKSSGIGGIGYWVNVGGMVVVEKKLRWVGPYTTPYTSVMSEHN